MAGRAAWVESPLNLPKISLHATQVSCWLSTLRAKGQMHDDGCKGNRKSEDFHEGGRWQWGNQSLHWVLEGLLVSSSREAASPGTSC